MRTTLKLERLEERDCPSTITQFYVDHYDVNRYFAVAGHVSGAPPGTQVRLSDGSAASLTPLNSGGDFYLVLRALDSDGGYETASVPGAVDATIPVLPALPTMTLFSATQSPGTNSWTFSGHIDYFDPTRLTVHFGGDPASLAGKTCGADANGNFSFTVTLNGTSTDDGVATAFAADQWGRDGNTLKTTVTL